MSLCSYYKSFFYKSFRVPTIHDSLTFQINIDQLGRSIDDVIFIK